MGRSYKVATAIGAFGIINTIAGFMVMIFLGMAQGMQPIAGYNYGAKRLDRVNKVLKITIRYASLAAVVCFLTCQCFPRQIAGMFVSNPDIINITAKGMQLYMSMFIFSGFQVVTSYLFQAINKASVSILLSLLRQAVCLIPACYYSHCGGTPRVFGFHRLLPILSQRLSRRAFSGIIKAKVP